jgi:murein endopeptidase
MSAAMMLFRSFVGPALEVAFLVGSLGCAAGSLSAPCQKASGPSSGVLNSSPDGAAAPNTALPPDAGGVEGGVGIVTAAPTDDQQMSQDNEELDDGAESPALLEGQIGQTIKHPLDGWTKQQIDAELVKNPAGLGSMSIGFTNAGALFNGVQMPIGEAWELVDPDHAWGTRETVDSLSHCINKVNTQFAGTAKMYIGHISAYRGGHLSPHVSHQAGRDVDVGYYYLPGQSRWYATARENNLDRQRTWAFIRALVTDSDVELILMDRSVQRLVRDYAVTHGEDRAWVDQLFDGGGSMPSLIRHAKGHATHIHVRFYNPLAQETGRRAYDLLLRRRIIQPPSVYVHHKVKEGESLGLLAKKYGTSSKAIQLANGMKSTLLRASSDCKIPQRGGVKACPRVVIPLRRTPPDRTAG